MDLILSTTLVLLEFFLAIEGNQPVSTGRLPATARSTSLYQQSKKYAVSAPTIAYQYAMKGFQQAKRTRDVYGEAMYLEQIAQLNDSNHQLIQAISFEQEVIVLLKQLPDHRRELGEAYLAMARYTHKDNQNQKSQEFVQKALKLFTLRKDEAGKLSVYLLLGNFAEQDGNQDKALAFYLKAHKLAKPSTNNSNYLALLEQLGNIYTKMDSDSKALESYQEGIRLSGSSEHYARHHIVFLRKTGNLHHKLGEEQQSLAYHKRALEKAQQIKNPEEQARSLMELSRVLKEKNADQSINHLNRALSIARGINNQKLAAEIYHSLSDIYRQQRRFSEALINLEAHHVLLDSLILINKIHESDIVRSNFELQNFKMDIQRLELSNRQRTFERNTGIVIIILILALLIFITYHFWLNRKLSRRLHISNRIKDKLFSIIGHDLRNPIGGITTMLALMEHYKLDEKTLKKVSAMKRQSEIALDILSSLLTWGQVQLQGAKVTKTNFDPRPIIQRNVDLLNGQAAEKDVAILQELSYVHNLQADRHHFDFIIRNLLSNAIKFSHEGGKIIISLANQAGLSGVTISVKDHGIGMSEKQLKSFTDGNLESSFGTKGEKGTGIGLALSIEYVKANGGKLSVTSIEDYGTTFSFNLPGT
ncbi:ATP-binding protein [Pedobacter aquatilis]|uniref:tetratricopeptide repeat-containing sensor histidine kinase n=1 Tax=Pedobacter aquatilis TaxID=351343 RepID=UPI0029302216|nr:ATP-binding protein [Pedobacter aquatilis]